MMLFANEGEVLVPHSSHDIIWRSIGINSKLRIDLYLNSSHLLEITNETANDGAFEWIVWQGSNLSQTTHSTYQFFIQDCETGKYFVFSPVLTITNERSMQIINPDNATSLTTGKELNIKWETDSNSFTVEIKLMKGDTLVRNLGSVRNSGSFSWKVPSTLQAGDDYFLIIIATDNSASATSRRFTVKPRLKSIPSFLLLPIILTCLAPFVIHGLIKIKKKKVNGF